MNARVWSYFFALAAIVACGARSELGATQDVGTVHDAGATSCDPSPTTTRCTTWVAGTPKVIAPNPTGNDSFVDTAAIARVSDCGVLVGWYGSDSPTDSEHWTTRLVGFDGVPLAGALGHPELSQAHQESATLSFVARGGRVGALVWDAVGCRFVVLDTDGHTVSGPFSTSASYCVGFAAQAGGWSFVAANGSGGSPPFTLVSLDGSGTEVKTPLDASPAQILWDRLTFEDGTFLIDSFLEDTPTGQDTDWLAPYDASGASLGPRVPVQGYDSAPVWLASTSTGALAGWSWDGVYALPVDRKGEPTGPVQNVSGTATIYEMTLVPSPNGDVLATWEALEDNHFTSYAAALAPDGTKRGAVTELGLHPQDSRVFGVLDATGTRALLVSKERDGIQALPLTCR